MFQDILIAFSEEQKKDNQKLLVELKLGLNRNPVPQGPVFIIGSWQTGDFGHVYAAAVRHFSSDAKTPFSILVLQAEGFSDKFILKDIEFAVGSVRTRCGGYFSLLHTTPISKNRAIAAMTELMKADNAREPFDATFWAEEAVKAMSHGQPLTEVWSALARSVDQEWYKGYNEICQSFMKDYVSKFGISLGRENFVCVWGRTSGAPLPGRPLGGANPQYDSSELGNHQLCVDLHKGVNPQLKAIFTVGDGFHPMTKQLSYVFDLGEFWRRTNLVKGRFQENGFFDFMTAFYDCNVVHVGMKSGGMDVLGLWGQKVVFIDSMRSPAVTRQRVLAWETEHLKPVPISQMPTSLGKAIEDARSENANAFKTTFSNEKAVKAMQERAADEHRALFDGFEDVDMKKIVVAVTSLLQQ